MRRFLVAVACLSGTAGALLGVVLTGSLSPAVAVSAPADIALRPEPDDTRPVITPPSFADIAERANPAVVNIDTLSRGGSAGESAANKSLRRQDGGGGRSSRSREGVRRGAGTGFLVDPEGYILTSDHVVRQAERLTVRLRDGRSLRARRVGSDPDTDIALLKVDTPAPLPFVQLGDSDRLRVGEWVVAIGNPLAYEHTVTVGIVSFIGRKLYNSSLDRYIQTDAAINLGNSGGPLIDATGAVIGINSAVSSHAANIGFAIPINTARDILPQLRLGHVTRGYIGAAVRELDPGLQRSLRLASDAGAVVQDIAPDSPADRAGLRVYDVIVSTDHRRAVSSPR
jgi:serine protease Do